MNERFFLIDCGEGTQIQLRRYKIRFGKINHVFISHIHGDHIFGLFGLLSSFQLLGRTNELHLYAPGEIKGIIQFYEKYFSHENKFSIILHPLGFKRKKIIYRDDWVEVISIPLKHRISTCGFLFREMNQDLNLIKEAIDKYKPSLEEIVRIKKGEDLVLRDGNVIPNSELTLPPWKSRSYAYISDTAFKPSVARSIQCTDLLFHEATFSADDNDIAHQTFHSTTTEAAKMAQLAGAKKLIIGHLSSRYKDVDLLLEEARKIFPESYIANEGDVFEVVRTRMENNDHFYTAQTDEN